MENIEWSALEYDEKERGRDWFWALGIIILTSVGASIIYGNYFFAGFLILGGIMLGFLAVRKPDTVSYKLSKRGFHIGSTLYPYENIKSFWVQKETHEVPALRALLFIHSERLFLPIIVVPIHAEMAEDIQLFLLEKNIKEEEMKEHVTEKIMEALGF